MDSWELDDPMLASVILTNVVPSFWDANIHSTGGEATVSQPHDDNALVRFDGFHSHRGGDAVHFPFPLNPLASLEPSAAFGEPEFRGDVRIDKGLEYFGDRLANKHSSVCNRHLLELEIVHSDSDFGCILRPKFDEQKTRRIRPVKYWEIIADNLSKAGWSWGCVSTVDREGDQFGLWPQIATINASLYCG